jgi:hypothetical protein
VAGHQEALQCPVSTWCFHLSISFPEFSSRQSRCRRISFKMIQHAKVRNIILCCSESVVIDTTTIMPVRIPSPCQVQRPYFSSSASFYSLSLFDDMFDFLCSYISKFRCSTNPANYQDFDNWLLVME